MHQIRLVENSLFQLGSIDAARNINNSTFGTENEISNGIAVSFLINQHKIEILDNRSMAFSDMIGETFNKEFLNMLQVCIFVPFLHPETPKP